jgi:hypothetical protein
VVNRFEEEGAPEAHRMKFSMVVCLGRRRSAVLGRASHREAQRAGWRAAQQRHGARRGRGGVGPGRRQAARVEVLAVEGNSGEVLGHLVKRPRTTVEEPTRCCPGAGGSRSGVGLGRRHVVVSEVLSRLRQTTTGLEDDVELMGAHRSLTCLEDGSTSSAELGGDVGLVQHPNNLPNIQTIQTCTI